MTDIQMSAEVIKNFVKIGRKIVAVGRNYRAHAAELGNAVPTKPMIFMKPFSAIIQQGHKIKIPLGCENLHQEVELGIVIGKDACKVTENNAMDYVAGYVLALDMTARDFQDSAKNKGHPWELSKGFDTSCPLSEAISKDIVSDPSKLRLLCTINDKVQQDGNTEDMIFSVPFLLQYITQYITLQPGDVILTGTPQGVCRVESGDDIQCQLMQQNVPIIQMKFSVQ